MTDTAVHKLPYWETDPDAFDKVFLGGDPLPGIARFTPIKRGKKYDDKSAKGKNKGPLTLQGYKRAEFEIELELLGEDEWEQLQEWMPDLESDPQPGVTVDKPVAWDISSPYTAVRNIEAIVITDVNGPEWREGMMYVTLVCVEFDKPKPAASGFGGGALLGVYIGTFANPDGSIIPDSRVATRGPLAVELVYDGDGNEIGTNPVEGPDGVEVYDWTMLATSDGTDGGAGYTYNTGQFHGYFLGEDTFLRQAWEAVEGKKRTLNEDVNLGPDLEPDATETPDQSKGAGSNAKPTASTVPSPSKTDAGP